MSSDFGLSSKWDVFPLSDFVFFQEGPGLRNWQYRTEGVPFVNIRCIKDGKLVRNAMTCLDSTEVEQKYKHFLLDAGDYVVSSSGTLGRLAEVYESDLPCMLNTSVIRFRPIIDSALDRRYLRYFLSSSLFEQQILAFANGSAQLNYGPSHLKRMGIVVPPWEVQEFIGKVLGSLDDRITLLRETNATLEAIAQALFKSWFVDFDPVRAKAEGLEPEGMDEATAALFPDSFEESELGLVPMGWNLVPFGELLTHTIGGDWGDEVSGEKNDIRVAIVRGTDIPDLQFGTANRVPIRYTSAKKLATRALQDGDLVLEVSGGSKDQPTGRALYLTDALLRQFDCPVEPASFCRLLRPVDGNTGALLAQHLTYIYAIGKTWEYQNQSTGIANFQTKHFLDSELVAMPPAEVLDAFAAVIRPIIDRAHLPQIRVLTQLRDTLLPRLISGQLRLPEAEAQIEAVCA
ncbi:restriction endonuclease subunit S [Pseudomonas sp.]|uniref:restriction endonuclease subunit S n=1 Tax=Pseudomonas sp. TaxID=306 RepID=UPI00289C4F73|nr:restriction endonuclease subunit S [Pseudomonas sp.]